MEVLQLECYCFYIRDTKYITLLRKVIILEFGSFNEGCGSSEPNRNAGITKMKGIFCVTVRNMHSQLLSNSTVSVSNKRKMLLDKNTGFFPTKKHKCTKNV